MWFVTIINSQGSKVHSSPHLDFLNPFSYSKVASCTSYSSFAWPWQASIIGSSSSYSALIAGCVYAL